MKIPVDDDLFLLFAENDQVQTEAVVTSSTATGTDEELIQAVEADDLFLQQQQESQDLLDENDQLKNQNEILQAKLRKGEEETFIAAECLTTMITHLTTEIGIRDKAAQIQKETYETEIKKLSETQREKVSYNDMQTDLLSKITELNITIEELRQGQEELIEKLKGFEDSMTNGEGDSIEPDTADFACQYDDTSYTRMRANDFYMTEARKNAEKLKERGRELQDDLRKRSKK